ncbi:hypothetical protein QE152_g1384 [Popillia japonica]|uniref:C2H2-type domain-containing protein n=1 Tax=Popillia japonica TaxID=7064 RepID=A0AAW1N739_POPJA
MHSVFKFDLRDITDNNNPFKVNTRKSTSYRDVIGEAITLIKIIPPIAVAVEEPLVWLNIRHISRKFSRGTSGQRNIGMALEAKKKAWIEFRTKFKEDSNDKQKQRNIGMALEAKKKAWIEFRTKFKEDSNDKQKLFKKIDCSLGLPPKTCPHCSKTFFSVKVKNCHIKRVHQVAVEGARRSLMLCPLCVDGSEVKTYESLRNHIKENHQVSIEQLTYQFSSNQDYEIWKNTQKIETTYAARRSNHMKEIWKNTQKIETTYAARRSNHMKNYKEIHYECNRSDNKDKLHNLNNLTSEDVFALLDENYFILDKLHNLNNLTSEDVFALLDEIPSDGSVISESSDEEFIAEVVSGGLMKVEEENSEWEDDDGPNLEPPLFFKF